jgi:hypothetical protein
MKIELDLPEIEGYEYTGEYRTDGEYYMHNHKMYHFTRNVK